MGGGVRQARKARSRASLCFKMVNNLCWFSLKFHFFLKDLIWCFQFVWIEFLSLKLLQCCHIGFRGNNDDALFPIELCHYVYLLILADKTTCQIYSMKLLQLKVISFCSFICAFHINL